MKKIQPQYTGGPVDASLPDASVALLKRLPGDTCDMAQQIGSLLGHYRDLQKLNKTEPKARETIRHLHSVAKQAQQLQDSLKLMPQNAKAKLADIYAQSAWQTSYREMEHALAPWLTKLHVATTEVAKDFKPDTKRRKTHGRNHLERALLSDVAELLEGHTKGAIGLIEIAGIAAEILLHAGVVGVPGTNKRARDTILTWRKRYTTNMDTF